MNEIETIEYKGYKIKIYQDEDPESPREWDNLGTMLCEYRGYDLGDVKESKDMDVEEIKEFVKRKDVIALPLYLLDHSGLWMRTGKFECDNGGWDTSMVGYITITHEKIKEEYSWKSITKKRITKIEGYLENEVKTYSDYLEGSVYGYVIEGSEEEDKDSCWGFYPEHNGHVYHGVRDELGYMVSECKSIIDGYVKEDRKEAVIQQNVTTA